MTASDAWSALTTPMKVGALHLSVASVVGLVLGAILTLLLARALARLAREGLERMGAEEKQRRRLGRWLWLALVLAGGVTSLHLSRVLVLSRALEEAHRIARFELVVLSGTPISPTTLVTFAGILVVGWWVSQVLQGAVKRAFARKHDDDEPDPTVVGVNRLLHYAVLVVSTLVGLETLGIDLSALLAAGAVVAVGLGLALQNVASNFVSGLVLMAERSVRPGDVLLVDGRLVKVVETRIRSTIARTLDDEDVILPNGALVETSIINYTLQDRLYRIRVVVGVAYESDLDAVFAALDRAGKEVPGRLARKEPVVVLKDFGSSSVDFELSVWTDDPWRMRVLSSETRMAIWRALKADGITIAFPQVDVHLDAPLEEGLLRLASGGEREP